MECSPNLYAERLQCLISTDPIFTTGVSQLGWTSTTITPATDLGYSLANDITYYWRVDAIEPNLPNDVVHIGEVWSFTTLPAIPIIFTQPIALTLTAGGTAVFTIESVNNTGYQWFKDEVSLTGSNSDTLTVLDVDITDEGNYYCVISNGNLVDDQASDAAALMIARQIAHWEFEDDLTDSLNG